MTIRGRGKNARVAPIRLDGFASRGGRLIARLPPSTLLDAAVRALIAQGFEPGDTTFAEKVRATGSEWLAQDVVLGDINASRTRRLVTWLAEDTVLEVIPQLWRGVTPTLVVASTRETAEGTELVVFSHPSTRVGSGRNDAAVPMQEALRVLGRELSAQNLLVRREQMNGIKNDGAPASQAVVRDLLGWR